MMTPQQKRSHTHGDMPHDRHTHPDDSPSHVSVGPGRYPGEGLSGRQVKPGCFGDIDMGVQNNIHVESVQLDKAKVTVTDHGDEKVVSVYHSLEVEPIAEYGYDDEMSRADAINMARAYANGFADGFDSRSSTGQSI